MLAHSALIVKNEKNDVLGVLSLLDIIIRPFSQVIHCLTPKTKLPVNADTSFALDAMKKEKTDVLPVYNGSVLEGVVFKYDLLKQANGIKTSPPTNHQYIPEILKSLFDNSQSATFAIDTSFAIIFLNKKAVDKSKSVYQKEISVGDNALQYIKPYKNSFFSSFEDGFAKAMNGEVLILEQKPQSRIPLWLRIKYIPIYESGVITNVLVTMTDISELKSAEYTIIQKQNELLAQIAWTQAHETRGPLATLLGLLSLVNKTELSEANKEVMELLEKTANKLDIVIRKSVLNANSGLSDITQPSHKQQFN